MNGKKNKNPFRRIRTVVSHDNTFRRMEVYIMLSSKNIDLILVSVQVNSIFSAQNFAVGRLTLSVTQ